MDLGAYVQIENLEKIANDNGIDIPRLRGYRLMKNEQPITKERLDEMMKECEVDVVKDLCESNPFWSPNACYYSSCKWTDMLKDYYLIKSKEPNEYDSYPYIGIHWDRIHGWKRRILKFEIKKQKRKIRQQYDMWNKYAGKENVLYIHSRMGGNNWKYWDTDKKVELMNQPWFLDRVDDYSDYQIGFICGYNDNILYVLFSLNGI